MAKKNITKTIKIDEKLDQKIEEYLVENGVTFAEVARQGLDLILSPEQPQEPVSAKIDNTSEQLYLMQINELRSDKKQLLQDKTDLLADKNKTIASYIDQLNAQNHQILALSQTNNQLVGEVFAMKNYLMAPKDNEEEIIESDTIIYDENNSYDYEVEVSKKDLLAKALKDKRISYLGDGWFHWNIPDYSYTRFKYPGGTFIWLEMGNKPEKIKNIEESRNGWFSSLFRKKPNLIGNQSIIIEKEIAILLKEYLDEIGYVDKYDYDGFYGKKQLEEWRKTWKTPVK